MNKIKFKTSLLFSFIILFLSVTCYGKNDFDELKISRRTNRIVKKIAKINFLMGSGIGPSGRRPKQFENFEELKRNASVAELTALTNHPNGVVRCYSFWALLPLKNVDLFTIVKNHLSDDAIVQTQFGCIGDDEKVGDFYLQLVTADYEDEEVKLLSKKQLKVLDSLLIYSENNLNMRFDAISKAEPTKALYPKIRELVIKENNQSALVTLSRYQKENDIELILSNKTNEESGVFYTYRAIQNFPNPQFLPFLEKKLIQTLNDYHYENEWRELYKAIAIYKNEKSIELLNIPFTKVQRKDIKKYHIEFVYDAILLNKCELYDNLFWKIWEEENLITLDGFKYLVQLDPTKTYELGKRELIPNYQIKKTETIPVINQTIFTENLKATILNFILLNDKPLAYNIIINKIDNAKVLEFELYYTTILQIKDHLFVEPLIKRMKTEENPHVYLRITEILASFNEYSINKQILETRKENYNMNNGWGSNALDEILKKNNIQ